MAAAAESSSSSTANRSSSSGTADSYIGSLISLTSKSEIRYEGILYNINTEESSIGLRNVRSFGTEGRKKDGSQVPPSDKIYEYILFRGSDIKDLQVKSSPPVQTTPPPINSDPAIIQSHYHPRSATTSATMPPAVSGSLSDLSSHSAQLGQPGSSFQGGLPLYQPGGNLSSWGPSAPPNANGTGLAMPMYWQGFYGTPNGLPQMHQQSLLRPPPGLSMPPPMQQLQYSGFNTTLPTAASGLSGSNLPEYSPSLVPTSSSSINSSSSLPTSTLPLTVPPVQSAALASDTSNLASSLSLNKAPVSGTSMSSTPIFPSLATLTTSSQDLTAVAPSISSKSNISAPLLQNQSISQPMISVAVSSSSILLDTPTPVLVTPGQLLQSGHASVSSISSASLNQTSQTAQKDVEVVQVSTTSSEPQAPVFTEAQPPILPLPPPARAHRPNGAPFHARHNYRGRGGRGTGISRPVTKFSEDFDFEAMNEKFKKDEVWGHLGKSKKEKEGNGNDSDEDDYQEEYDDEMPKMDAKPVYNKDDFFDTLSSNAADNDQNRGRTRFSEQMKIDAETFGEFSRYRGGRGGRGPYRGGRSRGSYYNRGGYGYGYAPRGRGRGVSSRAS